MITSVINGTITPFFWRVFFARVIELEFFLCHFTLDNAGLVIVSQIKD
jgi:hypothetical protein